MLKLRNSNKKCEIPIQNAKFKFSRQTFPINSRIFVVCQQRAVPVVYRPKVGRGVSEGAKNRVKMAARRPWTLSFRSGRHRASIAGRKSGNRGVYPGENTDFRSVVQIFPIPAQTMAIWVK